MIDMHHLHTPFNKLVKFPSVLIFLKVFIINDYWNLPSDFSASIDIITSFFFLAYIGLHWLIFQILNQPCILGEKKSHLYMVYNLFWYIIFLQWIQFANLVGDFYDKVHERYVSVPFFCLLFIYYWYQNLILISS